MRIIGLSRLHDFCVDHADCRRWITNWISDTRGSRWKISHDIRLRYLSVSFLANNVVVFNVRGNDYRLETQIAYGIGTVAVKWIGTHAEYTRRHG
jgi:mRNA interferase HigB